MNTVPVIDANFDTDEFLAEYWQKKPCLLKGLFPASIADFLDPNVMAGLSMEEFVESRLVFNKPGTWDLQNGPFGEETLTSLPKKDWILLVQAVDQLLPEIHELATQFRFVPGWRFDDAMVSVSAPGGNVGPHTDAYDVFLIQASGNKTWELMDLQETPPEYYPNEQLKIISNWHTSEKHSLKPGDVLYLPPGVGHYGYSGDIGVTISIGFRSPEVTQLADLLIGHLVEKNEPVVFSDPNPPQREHPGVILQEELKAISEMAQREFAREDFLLEVARLISAPKYAIEPPEELSMEAFAHRLASCSEVSPASDARIFTIDSQPDLLVANGELVKAPGISKSAVYHLTNYQSIPCNEVLEPDNTPLLELVYKLYSLAALELA